MRSIHHEWCLLPLASKVHSRKMMGELPPLPTLLLKTDSFLPLLSLHHFTTSLRHVGSHPFSASINTPHHIISPLLPRFTCFQPFPHPTCWVRQASYPGIQLSHPPNNQASFSICFRHQIRLALLSWLTTKTSVFSPDPSLARHSSYFSSSSSFLLILRLHLPNLRVLRANPSPPRKPIEQALP